PAHPLSAGDQVHENAQQRQHDDEDRPSGLGPAAQRVIAEDIDDDPEEQHQPENPEKEPHHREEDVEQRIVIHQSSLLRPSAPGAASLPVTRKWRGSRPNTSISTTKPPKKEAHPFLSGARRLTSPPLPQGHPGFHARAEPRAGRTRSSFTRGPTTK